MQKHIFSILSLLFITFSFGQKNIDLTSNLQYPDKRLNDIWGYVDTAGNEYALIGLETGFSIVDVSDAQTPEELFFIEDIETVWRDVKTWDGFAYVVNEEEGGLLIVDLRSLPDTIFYEHNVIDGVFRTAHNIFIDENGIAYLVGTNVSWWGTAFIDLNTSDRFEPEQIGFYDDAYVHDCFVRNDTLWTSELELGRLGVIDISDKSNPIPLAYHETTRLFTHNCWLSDDGQYMATTDERAGAFVDMYNVSNLNNITLLDKYQSSPGDSVVPHNTFFLGDYLWTSYYRDGVTLVDATKKNNLVEVGNYDTSPFTSADGFEGAWGVYPYLPSGNILVSDREEGLFIFSATYTRAAYLEGNITQDGNSQPIKDAKIEIIGTNYQKESVLTGDYTIGVADGGFYDIRFSHPFCATKIISNIVLETALTTTLDATLDCDFSVGIEEYENTQVNIFPTVFDKKITIEFSADSKLEFIELSTINGQVVKQLPIHEYEGTIVLNEKLASGIYVIQLQFEDANESYQVIKN
ncbi:MAG: choice-of-anchor B family protein [Chitinophagales bacterium]